MTYLTDDQLTKLHYLLIRHSVLKGEFTLASGEVSGIYLDVRKTALTSNGAEVLGDLIVSYVLQTCPFVKGYGGMSIGADPLVTAALIRHGHHQLGSASGIVVRKERKPHGAHPWLLGGSGLAEGSSILLLEDVVTTGGSSLQAANRLRKGGYVVDTCLCVVDREEGARAAMEAEGIELVSMTTLSALRKKI